MKTPLLKYLFLTMLCSLSSYSYWYLNARSIDLQTTQQQATATGSASSTTNVPFVQPPHEQDHSDNQQYKEEQDQNLLPDVEFLKFIIDKSKEGIPVLNLPRFFQ